MGCLNGLCLWSVGIVTFSRFRTRRCSPSGRRGSVTVPDGVTYLGHACFYDCEGVTDIYLPDSVININGQAIKRYDGEYTVTLHCAPGSYAREAAERMGITCK